VHSLLRSASSLAGDGMDLQNDFHVGFRLGWKAQSRSYEQQNWSKKGPRDAISLTLFLYLSLRLCNEYGNYGLLFMSPIYSLYGVVRV
jgi:hypothetical protein